MIYKLLEEQDLNLMLDFVDDEKTKYKLDDLKNFIDNDNSFGFIGLVDNKIIKITGELFFMKMLIQV